MGQTLFDKVWQQNTVKAETPDQPALLYVGLHLLHEITAPQAFAMLEQWRLPVRRPDLSLAMVDHCAPTSKDANGRFMVKDQATVAQIDALTSGCTRHGIPCFSLDHPFQGIVHAVAPELGLSRPGQVIVCGDSHTSTHGAFGAIAFGIGSSEVAEVLATQCILQRRPKNLRVIVDKVLSPDVSAKDLALYITTKLGAVGGKGYAIEYQGAGIRALSMEQRLTLCNMTIEMGARFGLIAPDQTTLDYLSRCLLRREIEASAQGLFSDPDAQWDKELVIDADQVSPMMSWGTNPAMSIAIGEELPLPATATERQAYAYMGWQGQKVASGRVVDHVFIGSCTNGRISDLRIAAAQMLGKTVATNTQCLIVPASKLVKQQAEDEGLDLVFRQAGATWGEPSCSLCNAMNGDLVAPGRLSVSTSNRNFEGRQGQGARTVLVSPASAAQIAIRGHL